MQGFNSTAVLLLIGGIAFGTSGFFAASSPDLCFAAGSVTYRLTANAPKPDYRVAIDAEASRTDLRVGLVDRVETADFALADDAGMLAGAACKPAGLVKTIRIVAPGTPSDITVALSRDAATADFTLYVHSARVSHYDAAALFAAVRHTQGRDVRADIDLDADLDGAADEVAQLR